MEERKILSTATKRNLIPKPSFAGVEIGKIPPQAIEVEEAVLGAMLLERNAVNDAVDILTVESFYKMEHQKIFAAIHELFGRGESIDLLSVTERLRKNGELQLVGGPGFLSRLTHRVASAAHTEYHARIISEKYILRKLIEVSSEVIKNAFDETRDVFDVLNEAETGLFKIAEGNLKKGYSKANELVDIAMEEIEKASKNSSGISGVPSGFHDLDRLTSGWQKSDMIVVAARPGMGKTAFVLSMAKNTAVDYKIPTAIFSLEMSNVQLVKRLMAMESEISSDKLRKGISSEAEWKTLQNRVQALSASPLFIDDTPALSVFELRAKCRRLKMQHDVQLIMIDYLQLMTSGTKSGNREQEISTISRSIKEIAKELNVPIIAISQLSRSVETRGGDKRPMLSDLRESGAIEQDADIVAFIYRAEYYKILDDENGMPTEGLGEIIVDKHRNGATETIRLRYVKKLTKFTNLDTFGKAEFGGYGNSEQGTITLSSKMNDDDSDVDGMDFKNSESKDTPF